jgi:hypothetical protein
MGPGSVCWRASFWLCLPPFRQFAPTPTPRTRAGGRREIARIARPSAAGDYCAANDRVWLTSCGEKRRARTSERSPDTGPSWPELNRKQSLRPNRGRGNTLCENTQAARRTRRRGSRGSRQEPRRFRLAEKEVTRVGNGDHCRTACHSIASDRQSATTREECQIKSRGRGAVEC